MRNKFRVKLGISIILLIAILHIIDIRSLLSAHWIVLYNSYFSDFFLPLGFYFLLAIQDDKFSFLVHWWVKLSLIFSGCLLAEIFQYFGIYFLGNTFDYWDIAVYAAALLFSVILDQLIFTTLFSNWNK